MTNDKYQAATVALDEILGKGTPYILLVGYPNTMKTGVLTTQNKQATSAILADVAIQYAASLKQKAN